jgi:hypothetical protein
MTNMSYEHRELDTSNIPFITGGQLPEEMHQKQFNGESMRIISSMTDLIDNQSLSISQKNEINSKYQTELNLLRDLHPNLDEMFQGQHHQDEED